MSSSRVDNSGQFTSQGSLLVGNTFSTGGGDIHFHASDTDCRTRSLHLGLHLGDAPTIDAHLFVGRSSELQAIEAVLHPPTAVQEQRRVVLGGLGGVGKTQLAIAYARQYHHLYDSVLWLNASSELTLQASFRKVAGLLVTAQDLAQLDKEQIRAHIYSWLSIPENTKWLLMFDNYDDPQEYNIREYCPYAGHGSVMITTRVPDLVGVGGGRLRVQPLQVLEESLQILQTRSQRESTQGDPYARCLANRLAGLPLALATAGAYLRKTTVTFEQYLQAYEQRFNVSPRRPVQLQEYADRTLYTTWKLSYDQIEKGDLHAAGILKLLAYFDNHEVWFELLHAGLGDKSPTSLRGSFGERFDFETVMSTLVDYCLLEVNPATRSYSVHRCVHDWLLGELNCDVDPQLYWYAFDCVSAGLDDSDWDVLGQIKYARVSQHGVRLTHPRFTVCDESDSDISDRLDSAVWIAQMLKEQVQLPAAKQMYLRALAGLEKALGSDHTSTLNTVNNLGSLYADQGKLEEAEQMYLRALAGNEKALGPDHALTLDSKHCLAILYCQQGHLGQAESMYQQLLPSYETALGEDHPSTLLLVCNYGQLHEDQNRIEEAEQMYQRSLVGYEKRLGLAHGRTRDIVDRLAQLHRRQGRTEDA